jgi:hypothetical protein
MSWWSSLIKSRDVNTHLRDARHAHNLFTQYGHLFSPKTKFLYHVVFEPTDDVDFFTNTRLFNKQIGVLVKSADLPGFRSSIENKQQYNRKKNMQTRVDYQDVRIVLHDDNLGATRSMLEEYYRFYFQDGNHSISSSTSTTDGSFNPRDKYSQLTPNYGLNNFYKNPFFSNIKIYQLSLQNWFSYTLINPLLSAWDHGGVESSDGSGMNENTITVAYESVLYNNGIVGEFNEPVGFTDPETGYDNTLSPLTTEVRPNENYIVPILNKITESVFNFDLPMGSNNVRPVPTTTSRQLQDTATTPRTSSTIPGYFLPTRDTFNPGIPDVFLKPGVVKGDPETTLQRLKDNPTAYNSFLAKVFNTGTIEGVSYEDFLLLPPEQKTTILSNLDTLILNGDYKLFTFMKAALEET